MQVKPGQCSTKEQTRGRLSKKRSNDSCATIILPVKKSKKFCMAFLNEQGSIPVQVPPAPIDKVQPTYAVTGYFRMAKPGGPDIFSLSAVLPCTNLLTRRSFSFCLFLSRLFADFYPCKSWCVASFQLQYRHRLSQNLSVWNIIYSQLSLVYGFPVLFRPLRRLAGASRRKENWLRTLLPAPS